MPHTKSAAKRMRQSTQRRDVNRAAKSTLKTWAKKFHKAAQEKSPKARELYRQCAKLLDQAASRGIIHRNTASRRKSRLALQLNKLAAKA